MNNMGKCQSKKRSDGRLSQEKTIELEKTLQLYLNEKDEYKEKYESSNRKYMQVKSQLEKSLRTKKDLQRRLSLSEENAASLYWRYAIEMDLNCRLKQSQKVLKDENERLHGKSFGIEMDGDWKLTRHEQDGISRASKTSCANSEIFQQLHDYERRICRIECRLKDGS